MVTDNTSQADDTTAFLRAARSGNLEKVVEFLDTDLDINTANSNGLNALHLASKDGHVEIVTELLKRGAKVDAATKKGNTALHIASLAGQAEIVNILIQYGAAVNIQSQNGFTPLYMAAQENHDQVVKLLLGNGANQSLATEDGFTPLAVAMQQGHDKVVSVLLENDSKGKVRLPALHIAAKKDDCKAADLLLQNDHKPDVTSKSGFTPLHIAAHYGNEEIARLLIKRGADVNYLAKHNISPLHVAAKWGKDNMVKILLENSAQIDAKTRDGLTPLHCAARSGHEQVVTTLLENSAPISARTKNGLAPLHMASQGDHVDAARVLLYHRAPVDEVTIDYLTSLHVAAHCGHVRVAKLLLDRKADPNARALNGFTPLHIACKKNRIKVVELLLKHGASIESTTESGLTPLHVASFMGCMNIVIFLLQHEANPDVPTVRGETPLHLAARANQTDIIRILLRNGAKVDARAREQQTPLHIASRLGNVDIVMLLLQHGAAVDTTTKDMYTALHIAAKEGQEEVAAILVDNNASLKAATKNGFTPLHVAAKYGNMNVAKILLQKDSKLDAQGKNDISPLHLACHYDHSKVANLLLEKGASPHLASQNGHTPLHIAARKNQMDIASTLLENGANANAESKAGFTPLHLSAQKGHYDMTNLLIEHGADPNHKAKNGLTALHLCAQEDFIRVASILVKNGANVESQTETGYRPIHVAAHFGNLSMIRFLLKHNAEIDVRTKQNYTPLHQAAQQGHAHIVTALLEGNASHKARTNDGLTALNIAQKLGYISVMEVLKGLPYDSVTPDNKNWEEKYKVIAPESLQETSFMSDSDDEGGSDALISEQPYRYLTADLMKSLRDDSLPIDVTRDDPIHRQVTKEEKQEFVQSNNYCLAENFDSNDTLNMGRLHFRSFLVSFLVDARGGAMKGCRHSGVRIIVPPRRATMPIRVTCRLVKPSKIANPPPLMEGEALATRIIEMGPVGATFLGPVSIDIPHFASIRGKEREIIILRSENGETWKEHDNSADNDDTLLNTPYDPQMSAMHSGRITRIITTDFPQYFAIITRIKQEVHVIGAEGGILISSVASHVQAVFPPGALTKKIKVGLQAHVIPAELTAKLLGNCVAVSPVITIEPRRRKFHKPITLTIPVPQAANKGMINHYGGETPTLRLLCSIAGGTSEAQWEDVTGSTPVTFMNDRVSFTTTVSARFWLMDCRNISEVPNMATELYKESLFVPYITNFVIYSKRMDILEATLRILCMTDGKEGIHTLERQEEFLEIVKSRDVEALDGKDLYIEFSGNLVPVTKSGVQLKFTFKAFRQNRLSFHVKVKDPLLDPVARMLFMKEPKVAKGEPPQQPICVLNIVLPEIVTKTRIESKEEYEDSNIIDQKIEQYTSKYDKVETQKEKYDRPKDTTPMEKKFITDALQKEQTDAAIHESFAQKAACPLESVDASYSHKIGDNDQEEDTAAVVVEKQTYSEKRKFWEDISRKRESYQRSESEVSRTSQLTINESDSEYLQNVPSEEETTEAISVRSETMEDMYVPDMSECSVAEKAHYFEEQIQKEMVKASPKLLHQDSLKEKDKAVSKVVKDERKGEKQMEEFRRSVDVQDKYAEDVEKLKDDVVEKKIETRVVEEVLKEKKEIKDRAEVRDLDERKLKEKEEPIMEVCKEMLNKERELAEGSYVAQETAEETDRIIEQIVRKEPVQEIKETVEIVKEKPVRDKESTVTEIKEKSSGKRVITEETTIIYKVRDDGTLLQEQVLKSVQVQGDQGETMIQIPEHDMKTKFDEVSRLLSEEIHDKQVDAKQKPEEIEIPKDVKSLTEQVAKKDEQLPEKESTDLEKRVTQIEDNVKQIEAEIEKMTEDRVKQIKKEYESRIPISMAKAEKDRTQKEDKSKTVPKTRSPSDKPDLDRSSPEKQILSPTKKKEFESRIPKRIIETSAVKQIEKDGKADFIKKETDVYTVTEKKSSEEIKEETSKTKKSESVSKTFTDPQEALKIFQDMSSMKDQDFATVTSKIDHTQTSKLEKKEIISSEISTGNDKIITHEEKEQVQRKKSSESKLTKDSPSEALEETKSKSEELDKLAVQKMSMNVTDGKETIDASASKSRVESVKEHISKKMEDEEGIMTQDSGKSKTKESDVDVALRIKRDSQKPEQRDDAKSKDSEKLSRPPTLEDLGKVEKIKQEESHRESAESFDVTQFIPSSKVKKEEAPKKEEMKSVYKDKGEVQSLEERQQQVAKEMQVRSLAETLIQSIETELEKRTKPEPLKLSKEYLTEIMDKPVETDHEKLADDLTKKFESIMKQSLEGKTESPRLKSTQEEIFDKISTRDSISISEDITKDEESSIQEKEDSYVFSQARFQDRDITISPSSISDQIELEETIDIDTNEFGEISKSSPVSEKQRSDRSGAMQAEPALSGVLKDKMVSEISGARVLEVLEPSLETESRQDSMDVPSLELDEQKFDEAAKEASIHKSAAVDSFEKMYQDQDITVSPSTVSEDTNIDYSITHEQTPVATRPKLEATVKRADSFEIESPPLVSPRSKVNLEIKPVTWMIGDKKIEVSETLQPSQAFNQELEEYESTLKQDRSSLHEETTDVEQESTTKSSEETSVLEFPTKESTAVDNTTMITIGDVTCADVPVNNQDLEIELIESKLEISCQELVDTLQREHDAKTPTEEYVTKMREAMTKAEEEAREAEEEEREGAEKEEKAEVKFKEQEEKKESELVPKSPVPAVLSIESQESQDFSQELSQDVSSSEESSKIDKPVTSKEKRDVEEGKTPEELEKEMAKRKEEELQRQAALDVHKPVRVDDVLKEWAEAYLTKVKPTAEEYKRHVEKSSEKHEKPLRTSSLPSDTCAFKIKKEEPSVDLSSRYAITVLDQVVKKEIEEVKESLEAAKQDLIEELSENSETVIQIKDSPSEFQFKLQPESIPNDLPFLYKPPSLDQEVEKQVSPQVEPQIKPQVETQVETQVKPEEESKDIVQTTESEPEVPPSVVTEEKELVETVVEREVESETLDVKEELEEKLETEDKAEVETEKPEQETIIAVQEEEDDEEGQQSPAPISRSDLSSDIDNKDDSSTLLPPQLTPRRRHKPTKTARKVTSDSEADVGSSSGDSSYYQSCDYEAGSGSRPSSSDVEALHSAGVQSATASEYETAMVSIEHTASRPTSQEYQTAASTLSSHESMKSLNSLSSGHLGSIDSTSELSETLVPSEAEADKEEIDENLECALVDDKAMDSDTSSSEMPLEETIDKIDSHIPCRMKRSSEMIFQQIVDDNATEVETTEETQSDVSPQKSKDSATSAFVVTPGALRSIDIMTSRVTIDGIQSVCTQVISTQDTEPVKESTEHEESTVVTEEDIQAEETMEKDKTEQNVDLKGKSSAAITDESLEGKAIHPVHSMLQQASVSTSSTSGMSFETVVEKDKSERHSPDSDSFELVDKPDIIDDFVVIEEIGREAEEFDSEGKSIRISAIPQTTSKTYDRDLENLIAENKGDAQVSTSQSSSKNNELFEFESEESPPQASNDDQYSQSYSDEEQYEGSKKWVEMQYQGDPRVYDIEYDRGPLEDIKEEEITDFEAGSSRFGSLGSHKESIGSVGSMRGSFGSTPDYDVLTGKKYFTKPTDHDTVSLSSLQEFEHLESTVAAENSRRFQCGSQDSTNNGSLPRRYMTSRSGHGDDISLSSLKDFEGLEKACREAHLIELRAREEQALLEHESPENKYKLENLPRTRSENSAAASFHPSTSDSDDYEKRIKEIDEIIRIAQSNVEKMDRQDDTTEDISQIEVTDMEKGVIQAHAHQALPEVLSTVDEVQGGKETNVMETSTDSLELEDNMDKKRHPLCQSSDSLEMKTTLDFPSLSSDSLNNIKDSKDTQLDSAEQFSRARRISSDSLEVPVSEPQDVEGRESNGNHVDRGTAEPSLERATYAESDVAKNGKSSTSGT